MNKSFDDLYNEFFSDNPNEKKSYDKNDARLVSIKNLIESLGKNVDKAFENSLGKPDKIEFYNKGEFFFEKRIWYTEDGQIEELIVLEDNSMTIPPPIKKTLKEKLDEAIENEEFEKAAAIRDEINKRNNLQS